MFLLFFCSYKKINPISLPRIGEKARRMVPHFDEICEEKRKIWENMVGKKRKEKRTIPFTYLSFLIFYDPDHDERAGMTTKE